MSDFETKDSGARQHWESGMQRDTEAGKARFDLMIPEGVPYEDQLLTRFAMLLGRGAEKYDDRNWEKANSEDEIKRAKSSAYRHFMQWICGETDEDHAAAVIFNLLVVETTRTKLAAVSNTLEAEDVEVEWRDPTPRHEVDLEAYADRIAEILGSIATNAVPARFIAGVHGTRDSFGPDLLKKRRPTWIQDYDASLNLPEDSGIVEAFETAFKRPPSRWDIG